MHVGYGRMINFPWSAVKLLKFHKYKMYSFIFFSDLSIFEISSIFPFAYTTASEAVLSALLRYKQEAWPEARHLVWTLE